MIFVSCQRRLYTAVTTTIRHLVIYPPGTLYITGQAIALSNAVSKLLECIMFNFIVSEDEVDDAQFGFKNHHTARLCLKGLLTTTDVMVVVYMLVLLILVRRLTASIIGCYSTNF